MQRYIELPTVLNSSAKGCAPSTVHERVLKVKQCEKTIRNIHEVLSELRSALLHERLHVSVLRALNSHANGLDLSKTNRLIIGKTKYERIIEKRTVSLQYMWVLCRMCRYSIE